MIELQWTCIPDGLLVAGSYSATRVVGYLWQSAKENPMDAQAQAVTGSSVTISELIELLRQLRQGTLTGYHLRTLLEHRNPFNDGDWDHCYEDWELFFTDLFGIRSNLLSFAMPPHRSGFNQPIIVPQDLTLARILDVCRKFFAVSTPEDTVEASLIVDERHSSGTYGVWVRMREESDEELANRSAWQLKGEGIPGITLTERLLLELMCFWKTNTHLDVRSVTLCSGSRWFQSVPFVGWCQKKQKLFICRYSLSWHHPSVRCREVVAVRSQHP